MSRRKFIATLLITLLLISACGPAATPAPASPPPKNPSPTAKSITTQPTPAPRTAEIADIQGVANRRETEESDWATAMIGQELSAGNQVRTESTSKATIHFADGAVTRLGPETLLTVSDISGTPDEPIARLQLFAGEVFVMISRSLGGGSLTIETPVGVAAARGTFMSVRFIGNRIIVICLETKGRCVVENDEGEVELQSGQQTEIFGSDQPPTPPEAIDETEIENWIEINPEAEEVINEDEDGDGFRIADGDCDDADPAAHPEAGDPAGDGLDQNCDGIDSTQPDSDGDGFTAFDGDCDETDPAINPGAVDTPDDGLDQNCDGVSETTSGVEDPDNDGDGYAASLDCNDGDPGAYPDAPEIADDGLDQNCDGADETATGTADPDSDDDGYAASADCDDADPAINPGLIDTPGDGIDQNCDGKDGEMSAVDDDGDGYPAGADCNDADPSIHPDAADIPDDGLDQDCDGADSTAAPTDADGDGYPAEADCDDSDPAVNPATTEVQNGADDDCDGEVDEP